MKVYLFPGQGSQRKGMGAELFKNFPKLVERINDNLGYSIQELCLEHNPKRLNNTLFTQVAIYVVNALSYYKKLKEDEIRPDVVAGHSIGEYNALLAAEVFDFFTGLELVKKRAELMSQASEGGMAAVLGLTSEEVDITLKSRDLNTITIANYNSRTQNVISGPKQDMDKAVKVLKNTNAKMVIPLMVSGAFHSSLMKSGETAFEEYMNKYTFSKPQLDVMSNYTGQTYVEKDVFSSLKKQISNPVRWYDIMKGLMQKNATFFEIGHGDVLTKIIGNIQMNR